MRSALRRLLEQRAQPITGRGRAVLLIVATAGIGVASVWAWRSSGLSFGALEWTPVLILFLVAAPLSLGLKAAEYRLAAAIAGSRPSLARSIDVAVVSSAANLLPLPGSLLVTIHSLSEDGSDYSGAMAASAVPGLTWLGITGIGGGAAIAVAGPPAAGAAVAAGGLLVLIVAGALFAAHTSKGQRLALGATIVAVETGWLGVSALRLGLAVSALGVTIDIPQALALSVAGALTVAIGFFPGGLGLREALIAAISPLIGLELGIGILLGSLDRVVWLVFLAIAGFASTLRHR